VISSLEKPIALLTEELASNNSFSQWHASSFWECCWWVVRDKFNRRNMVVTCNFVVCKCEMRDAWGIGHWSRAVSCLLIRTLRVHIN